MGLCPAHICNGGIYYFRGGYIKNPTEFTTKRSSRGGFWLADMLFDEGIKRNQGFKLGTL